MATDKPAKPQIVHNELIHEVEETLKQQELEKLWKEYGGYIIAGIIVAILLTAGMSGWRSYKDKVNTGGTAVLLSALSDETTMANVYSNAAQNLQPGQRAMAFLIEAGALLEKNQQDEALAVYQKAASDSGLPKEWHDLAVLLSVRMEWAASGENITQRLMSQIEPLLKDPNSPWHYHARLQAALMAAHGPKDYMAAHTHLSAIQSARNVPPSLAQRAKALQHVYKIHAEEMQKGNSGG